MDKRSFVTFLKVNDHLKDMQGARKAIELLHPRVKTSQSKPSFRQIEY
jgi:hypothetical protein